MPIGYLYVYFIGYLYVYFNLLPIFRLDCLSFLLLSCMHCLYILEINLLLVTSFANIFSHSVDCLHLFMVSFAVQKLVSLIKSHLCIFVYFYCLRTSLVAQTVKCLHTMRETGVRSLGREDPLEKEMATHSSILAWKIPWMEEPGWLLSMGL